MINYHVNFIQGVSIHAPVRGATLLKLIRAEPKNSFNPRPRAGGDQPYL